MGWCSATEVFDPVAGFILERIEGPEDRIEAKKVLTKLIEVLEDRDWDCQQDSDYWDDPLIQEIFKEIHPDWFEDED